MSESEYYATEFADADLDALADGGEYYLEESGFHKMPTQKEIKEMSQAGEALLFIDCLEDYDTQLRASARSRKCRTADASPLGVRPKGRAQARTLPGDIGPWLVN